MMAQSLSATSSSRLATIFARRSYSSLDDSVRVTRSHSSWSRHPLKRYNHSFGALPANGPVRCASSTLDNTVTPLQWSSWELLVCSIVASFVSGAAIYYSTSNASMGGPTPSSEFGFPSWGVGGGGSSLPPLQGKTLVFGSKRRQEQDGEDEPTVATHDEGGAAFDVSRLCLVRTSLVSFIRVFLTSATFYTYPRLLSSC